MKREKLEGIWKNRIGGKMQPRKRRKATKAPSRLNVPVVCRNPTNKQRGEQEGFCREKFFPKKNSKAELSVQKIFKIQNTSDESDF